MFVISFNLINLPRAHDPFFNQTLDPQIGHALKDVHNLIKRSGNTLVQYPMEIYYSALVLLPKSVCLPLARERHNRALPTVIRGLPETWEPPERSLLAHSLFISADKPRAHWLSRKSSCGTMIHEWNIRTNAETQIPVNIHSIGHAPTITKLANNGYFSYSPESCLLSFVAFSSSAGSNPEPRLWDLSNANVLPLHSETTLLHASDNGEYACVLHAGHPQVYLVDVKLNSCHWLPLSVTEPSYSGLACVTFSSDAKLLAIHPRYVAQFLSF